MTHKAEPLFDAVVRIDKLPAAGRSLKVEADARIRSDIAEAMKVTAVTRFQAELTIVPLRGGLRAQGWLKAHIEQPSVVTFEPVFQDIAVDIDRVFLPASGKEQPAPGSEVFIDLEDDDFPDHIDGPEVDLSALLLETLGLEIDPYPRAAGESLDALGLDAKDGEEGPFAALARLKAGKKDED